MQENINAFSYNFKIENIHRVREWVRKEASEKRNFELRKVFSKECKFVWLLKLQCRAIKMFYINDCFTH